MFPSDGIKHTNLRSRREAPRPKIERPASSPTGRTARAYDHVGNDYSLYADGECIEDPSTSANRFAHADTIVWNVVRASIDQLRAAGVSTVRVLDAGCGPGIWSRRIAEYAHNAGLGVAVVGVDISRTQLDMARNQAASFVNNCRDGARPTLTFMEQDLAKPLPWADGHFHIALCNYAVMNHLNEHTLAFAIGELCRVATDRVISTIRSVGSPATACIIGTEDVLEYRHDPKLGQLALLLKDGTRHKLSFNVYASHTLATLFSPHADLVDMRAIDVFLCRFAPDEKWTASLLDELPGRTAVIEKLKEMEDALCRQPGWIDHGTHVLVVAQPKAAKNKTPIHPMSAPEQTSVVMSFADFLANRSN